MRKYHKKYTCYVLAYHGIVITENVFIFSCILRAPDPRNLARGQQAIKHILYTPDNANTRAIIDNLRTRFFNQTEKKPATSRFGIESTLEKKLEFAFQGVFY